MTTWIPIVLSILALIVAGLAVCISKKAAEDASQFGAITAERQWHETVKEYYFEDERIRRWEESKGLSRDGPVPTSAEGLERELSTLNWPSNIQDAYRRRWRSWNSLREMSEAYKPFKERLSSIDLSLPSKPALPAGRLLPIRGTSLDELDCEFAGIRTRCKVLIRSGVLVVPEELFGSTGMFRFTDKIEIDFPFSVSETPDGLVFSATLYGPESNPLVVIKDNQWDLMDPTLRHEFDARRLEVIGKDGIPIFRLHLDEVEKTVHIGGRFVTRSGDMIAAFPEKLITESFVLEGLEWRQGHLHIKKMNKLDKAEVVGELRKLKPWFYYESQWNLDSK